MFKLTKYHRILGVKSFSNFTNTNKIIWKQILSAEHSLYFHDYEISNFGAIRKSKNKRNVKIIGGKKGETDLYVVLKNVIGDEKYDVQYLRDLFFPEHHSDDIIEKKEVSNITTTSDENKREVWKDC
eukprot:UN01954